MKSHEDQWLEDGEREQSPLGCMISSLVAKMKVGSLLVGSALAIFGVQEVRLARITEAEPESVTLEALAQNGPGENAHIIVGDYFLCDWCYVYQENRTGRWTDLWIPAVPLDSRLHRDVLDLCDEDGLIPDGVEMPIPDDYAVIFKLTNFPSEYDLERIAMADTVRGVVINEIEDLAPDVRALLRSDSPLVDFDRVHIFEAERSPPTAIESYSALGIGLGLLVLGAFLYIRGSRNRMKDDEMIEETPTAGAAH